MRLCVLLISLTACKASISDRMADAGPDAPRTIDGNVIPDGRQLGPWETPTPIGITPVADDDPSATADLLELYFNRSGDIYVAKRNSHVEPWGAPALVAELSTVDPETTPEVTYDGLTIYIARAPATGGLGGNDIYVSTRASRAAAWGAPTLVTELSSAAGDGAATLIDPLLIMIDSERATATMLDIYVAKRASTSAPFETPSPVSELNTAQSEGNPMLGPGQLTVYFDSNRTANNELYVATRTSISEPFGAPTPIAELNTTSSEADPWIAPDGRTMYFTSNRDGTQRLWQTTR